VAGRSSNTEISPSVICPVRYTIETKTRFRIRAKNLQMRREQAPATGPGVSFRPLSPVHRTKRDARDSTRRLDMQRLQVHAGSEPVHQAAPLLAGRARRVEILRDLGVPGRESKSGSQNSS
jgi:hypothetical protein